MEVKLIKQFGQLMSVRSQIEQCQTTQEIEEVNRKYLKQWLRVVGLSAESRKALEVGMDGMILDEPLILY